MPRLLLALLLALLAPALTAQAKPAASKGGATSLGKPAADAPPQILTIPEDQFQRLELRKAASEPLLLQKPTLSKTHIVFAYAGDLWSVPREGGDAVRLAP